jgi:hypothetical protein
VPARQKFDAELAALEALREVSREIAKPQLVKAIGLRNNFLVAKAAAVALHHHLTELTPDLAAALDRFLDSPAKADPQCWAKNELAKTLAAFEYQEPELFLRGMRHVQMEPVWGGSADSAGRLRSTCALALVQCRDVNSHRVLMHLVPLLADKEVPVQVNAARAIEQVGTDAAALLLRLRAELGSEAPEILNACYAGVLSIEGPSAISWAATFLPPANDAAGEAAMAIAQTHTAEAFQVLRSTFEKTRDDWFRSVLLSAIALTRQPEAAEWLLDLIAQDEDGAGDAHEALCRSAPSEATRERLQQLGKPCLGD